MHKAVKAWLQNYLQIRSMLEEAKENDDDATPFHGHPRLNLINDGIPTDIIVTGGNHPLSAQQASFLFKALV